MMHIGPYDAEPASFARMEEFCAARGLTRVSKVHREIYMSDPRKTAPEKLRTVLRFKVK
ncbi:MAG: GyrI-like domain-containing protein [Desulfobacterales bacterium]|nr:GyrI-like domain-containing protein [Desulfobacterales bacterium]